MIRGTEVGDRRLRMLAAGALVAGAIPGVAGTCAHSAELRGLAWGVDGTFLVVATALLAIHHMRRGSELAAAGFLVFVAGETLILSGAAMSLEASSPLFGAGAGQAAAVLCVSLPGGDPVRMGVGALPSRQLTRRRAPVAAPR